MKQSMRLATKAGVIFDNINRAMVALGGVIAILMMLIVTVDVIMRYALNHPLGEIVREGFEHGLLYLIILPAAWMLKKNRHIIMETVLESLNPKRQALMNFANSILGAIVCFIITWYGAKVTMDYFVSGTVFGFILNIPVAPVIIAIPVGFFLLFVEFSRKSYGYLVKWRSGEMETTAKPEMPKSTE